MLLSTLILFSNVLKFCNRNFRRKLSKLRLESHLEMSKNNKAVIFSFCQPGYKTKAQTQKQTEISTLKIVSIGIIS